MHSAEPDTQAEPDTPAEPEPPVLCLPAQDQNPPLPGYLTFPVNVADGARCQAIPVESKRSFGAFAEKTLRCNRAAKHAIDQVCHQGGFTQSWKAQSAGSDPDIFTMSKIPAIILVKLMLGLPAEQEANLQSLVGAFAICMDPEGEFCLPGHRCRGLTARA